MERIDHVAIVVNNINRAIEWYTTYRDCKVKYQDDSWALLEFENINLALVLPHEHLLAEHYMTYRVEMCTLLFSSV